MELKLGCYFLNKKVYLNNLFDMNDSVFLIKKKTYLSYIIIVK